MVLQSPFLNDKRYKEKYTNSKTYKKKLEKQRIPDIKSIMKINDWLFIKDLVQDFF